MQRKPLNPASNRWVEQVGVGLAGAMAPTCAESLGIAFSNQGNNFPSPKTSIGGDPGLEEPSRFASCQAEAEGRDGMQGLEATECEKWGKDRAKCRALWSWSPTAASGSLSPFV